MGDDVDLGRGDDGAGPVDGIDGARVVAWLSERVDDLCPPVRFERIEGGLSNLTFRVIADDGRRWVLRRPPLGHVLATAHDMGREATILRALESTPVPVPRVVDFCDDVSVTGAAFYVMEYVDGVVASSRAVGEQLSIAARRRAGDSLVEALARIHSVDVDSVGLGSLGRREAYVERQLSRWDRQWNATKDVDVPEMDELHRRLVGSIPTQGPATLVHGDFRLDNCLLDEFGEVVAVLDWELCTLGDPLADLGLLLVYWGESGDRFAVNPDGATSLPGFADRAHLVGRYAATTGRDPGEVPFYVSLGYWKLACILQGVLVRFRAGAMGGGSTSGTLADGPVVDLARAGLTALDGIYGG